MNVLPLNQPIASLAAHGVCTVATFPHRPKVSPGERLLLSATKADPPHGFWHDWIIYEHYRSTMSEVWMREKRPTRPDHIMLPLGHVVGSAVVDTVVPIEDLNAAFDHIDTLEHGKVVYVEPDALTLAHRFEMPPRHRDLSDQLPFADFTPGRWAVLLTDAAPCETRCPTCWGEGWKRSPAGPWDSSTGTCPRCGGAGTTDPWPHRNRGGGIHKETTT